MLHCNMVRDAALHGMVPALSRYAPGPLWHGARLCRLMGRHPAPRPWPRHSLVPVDYRQYRADRLRKAQTDHRNGCCGMPALRPAPWVAGAGRFGSPLSRCQPSGYTAAACPGTNGPPIMLKSLPNALTLLRIAIIPPLVALFYVSAPWGAWAALGLFVVAALSDYFDGWLARRLGQMSVFGRLLDPIADKMLVAAVLLMLVAAGRVEGLSVIAAVIILLREILISGLREYMAGRQAEGLPVTRLAKWKTTVQMAAIALLIIAPAVPAQVPVLAAGLIGLWLAAVLTVVTGWDYVARGLRLLMADDRGRDDVDRDEGAPTARGQA